MLLAHAYAFYTRLGLDDGWMTVISRRNENVIWDIFI